MISGLYFGERLICENPDEPSRAPDWLPFKAPVEHCISQYNDTDCSPAQHGGFSTPRPGFESRPEHHSTSHPTRYFLRIIGTAEIPTDAMRAMANPVIPTPSSDMMSDGDISIRKEPLVD